MRPALSAFTLAHTLFRNPSYSASSFTHAALRPRSAPGGTTWRAPSSSKRWTASLRSDGQSDLDARTGIGGRRPRLRKSVKHRNAISRSKNTARRGGWRRRGSVSWAVPPSVPSPELAPRPMPGWRQLHSLTAGNCDGRNAQRSPSRKAFHTPREGGAPPLLTIGSQSRVEAPSRERARRANILRQKGQRSAVQLTQAQAKRDAGTRQTSNGGKAKKCPFGVCENWQNVPGL